MVAKILFALIGTETLDGEASLVFDERLPGFEDLKDSFGRFIGNEVYPTIASEVVGEGDKITSIADRCGCNWSADIRVDEFERPGGAVFVSDKGLASLFAKETEVTFLWSMFNANSAESFSRNMTKAFVPELGFAD